MDFNPEPAQVMHLDLNSCFAMIEQQANPLLRGKPIAVAAYPTPSGCILASSIEAKRLGIKTGMQVKDGKIICPNLVVLPPDPAKYRNIHLKFRTLLANYSEIIVSKSIDEFVLKPACPAEAILAKAGEIKQKIKKEIGEAITVSIGIAPNRFLAKVASGLHKPDGLDEINKANFQKVYAALNLTDLCGIKTQNAIRLNSVGIYTVLDFYRAPLWKLKAAFASIAGYYWYLRLRGWEVDDFVSKRGSYGNSFALPKPFWKVEELSPILCKLVEKTGFRLRKAGYRARGIHLAVSFRTGRFWHKGALSSKILFDSRAIYKRALRLLIECPIKEPVREMAVSVFGLVKNEPLQLEFFEDVVKNNSLVDAIDKVNKRWGNFIVAPARMLGTQGYVPDRIAFNSQ